MRYLVLLFLLVSLPLQGRVITACGHPEYPPVSWLEADSSHGSSLQGVAPSLAKYLFDQLGLSLSIDTSGNWERCLQEVKAGNIDVIVGAYKTEARTAYLEYTSTYTIADPLTIFVNQKDNTDYKSIQDLQGKRVGLLLGDSFGDQFDQFLDRSTQKEFVSKGRQNLAKLAHQRIDFMPLGINSGQLQIAKFGFQELIKLAPLTIGTEYFFLAVGKHSQLQQYLPFISQSITALRNSGKIKLLQRCFSRRYLSDIQGVNCHVE
jgi:polar amino acid transport system substrate-binding protein